MTCRELIHDLRDFPEERIALRQRESDELVSKLAAYDGRPLTITERKARLELRDKLAGREQKEAWTSRGLKLLLGDRTISLGIRRCGARGSRVSSITNSELLHGDNEIPRGLLVQRSASQLSDENLQGLVSRLRAAHR